MLNLVIDLELHYKSCYFSVKAVRLLFFSFQKRKNTFFWFLFLNLYISSLKKGLCAGKTLYFFEVKDFTPLLYQSSTSTSSHSFEKAPFSFQSVSAQERMVHLSFFFLTSRVFWLPRSEGSFRSRTPSGRLLYMLLRNYLLHVHPSTSSFFTYVLVCS